MEDLFTLVVIAFVVLSQLGGLLTKKKPGPQVPPQRRPERPREQPAGWEEDAAGEPVAVASGQGDEGRAASEMIPDDLWEILTGERRPTAHVPEPESEFDPEDSDSYDDEVEESEHAYAEPVLFEQPVEREVPHVISLETLPPPPEIRHRQFHERLESLATRRETRRVERDPWRLGGRRNLRRAMVLREILGPPKALE